jgi:hypothetical protein
MIDLLPKERGNIGAEILLIKNKIHHLFFRCLHKLKMKEFLQKKTNLSITFVYYLTRWTERKQLISKRFVGQQALKFSKEVF